MSRQRYSYIDDGSESVIVRVDDEDDEHAGPFTEVKEELLTELRYSRDGLNHAIRRIKKLRRDQVE